MRALMTKLVPAAGDAVQRMLRRFGLHVSRSDPNRFAAIPVVLAHLHCSGYRPRVVIDGGANVGRWTSMAHALFEDASFHMIEPQPGCAAFLDRVRQRLPRVSLHAVALSAPGVESVRMTHIAVDSHSEGAFVTDDPAIATTALPAATLDGLFADRVTRSDRVFLKLDLEGQELNALLGAERLLPLVEVILCEVRFFDIDRSGCAVFGHVAEYLWARGFEVYDVAALNPRVRDNRLSFGDVVFVRRDSALREDVNWL
jgi:FkbM family methyltransferase